MPRYFLQRICVSGTRAGGRYGEPGRSECTYARDAHPGDRGRENRVTHVREGAWEASLPVNFSEKAEKWREFCLFSSGVATLDHVLESNGATLAGLACLRT